MDEEHCIEIRHGLRWMYVVFSVCFLAISVLFGCVRLGFLFFWGTWFLLCLALAVYYQTARWHVGAQGVTQTGLLGRFAPWSDVQHVLIERSAECPWYCKIAIRTRAGQRLRMDSPDFVPRTSDSVARFIEFVQERVPSGSLEVKDREGLKKEAKGAVLGLVLMPLLIVATSVASPIVAPFLHDHVWRPLLDFLVRLFR